MNRSFVTHLESSHTGEMVAARDISTAHESPPLWVRYDLEAVGRAVSRDNLAERAPSLWRYRELLPVDHDSNIVTLGEGMSPLLPCDRLAKELGVAQLLVKDEAGLPTGSFKARGMTAAVSMAKETGAKRLAVPTAGNAGGALAAYAARAGMECYVFMPEDTPEVNRFEAAIFGAKVFLVRGLITECGGIVREGKERMGWYDVSTLKEPYRIEGKKTMGLELAEQMDWTLPDVILYPTGGGTGLIGMWKAFAELEALGWLESPKKPRMFSCQSTGCEPITLAFEAGERKVPVLDSPHTLASGLRVPKPLGDFLVLDAVRQSGGKAMSLEEERIVDWMKRVTSAEGISLCPESACCFGVLEKALASGDIKPDETVVVFNTGAFQKYLEVIRTDFPVLDPGDVDWGVVEALST